MLYELDRLCVALALGPREVRYLTTAPYKKVDKIVRKMRREGLAEEARWELGPAGRTIIAVAHSDQQAAEIRLFVNRELGNHSWETAIQKKAAKRRSPRVFSMAQDYYPVTGWITPTGSWIASPGLMSGHVDALHEAGVAKKLRITKKSENGAIDAAISHGYIHVRTPMGADVVLMNGLAEKLHVAKAFARKHFPNSRYPTKVEYYTVSPEGKNVGTVRFEV